MNHEIRTRERELYPLVARFAVERLGATRAAIIDHPPGSKLHPDLVAARFPVPAGSTADLLFYSFEVKYAVNSGNLRDCHLATLTSSLWAHAGYLVAAEWSADPEFRGELSRLSRVYGVGAIRVDVAHPERSEVLLTAGTRDTVDWTAFDDLVATNQDMRAFWEAVQIDLNRHRLQN